MRITIMIALACFSVATAASAKDAPDEDKIVCKRQQDADTGSHFATTKKVCMKKSEWKEREDEADRTLERVRNGGAAGPLQPTGGGPG
jgi:hypothetical protein